MATFGGGSGLSQGHGQASARVVEVAGTGPSSSFPASLPGPQPEAERPQRTTEPETETERDRRTHTHTHTHTGAGVAAGRQEEADLPTSEHQKELDKVKKLCAETDREWRKNIKRKVCDASVVTEQIAERAIDLLRENSMKAKAATKTTQNSNAVLTPVDKSELERLMKDKTIRAIAEKRLSNLANKATLLILERLMAHKWAWLFNEPVNADELNLKDYHKIVKKPMALSVVKNKAQAGQYRTASEAASDIRLVFENAQLYNKPGSDVNIMASAMLEKFEELWQSKVTQKFNEEETLAKNEESMARKKKADALKAHQNGGFRQKCQSYERLLCDVENFLVDVQQQIIVSCKPLSSEKRKRAQKLIQETAFEKMKPALAIILQRYPEMLNTATQEVEVDLSKVDALTLRQVLILLERTTQQHQQEQEEKEEEEEEEEGGEGTTTTPTSKFEKKYGQQEEGVIKREFSSWINAMSSLVAMKRRKVNDANTPDEEEEIHVDNNNKPQPVNIMN